MTREEMIELARQAGMEQDGDNFFSPHYEEIDVHITDLERFTKLVEAKKEAEMQQRIDSLYAMYQQACQQRDMLMDQQRAQIATIKGQIQ